MTAEPTPEPTPEETAADARAALHAVEAAAGSSHGSLRERLRAHMITWWPVWVAWAASRIGVLAIGMLSQYAAVQRGLEHVPFLVAGTFPHYEDVARNGYTLENAFEFPLLPMLMAAGSAIGIPMAISAMLVVNVAFLAGLLCMAMLGERYVGQAAAVRGATYLALFPAAYAFSIASTESLLLLGLAGSALAATRGRWGLAIALGLMAGLTRPPAVLVAIAVGGIAWAARSGRLPAPRMLVATIAAPMGVTAFFTYLLVALGDFMAAVHAQEQFGREMSLAGPLVAVGSALQDLGQGVLGPFIELVALAVVVALVVVFARGAQGPLAERRGWVLFAAGSLLLPLATGLVWQIPRFALLIPPVFWALGMLGRHQALHHAMLVLLPMGLAVRVVFEVVGVAR